jgi:mRNA interferase MazF
MAPGHIWWAFPEKVPVVLLSVHKDHISAIQVVSPADPESAELFIEVPVGKREGLSFDGVVRAALPQRDLILCNWLLELSPADLLEHKGSLSRAKLLRVKSMLARCNLP